MIISFSSLPASGGEFKEVTKNEHIASYRVLFVWPTCVSPISRGEIRHLQAMAENCTNTVDWQVCRSPHFKSNVCADKIRRSRFFRIIKWKNSLLDPDGDSPSGAVVVACRFPFFRYVGVCGRLWAFVRLQSLLTVMGRNNQVGRVCPFILEVVALFLTRSSTSFLFRTACNFVRM